MNKIQTKKDEILLITSSPKQMLDKYLSKRVLRTWTEDFVDGDTGEVVSVERNTVIFDKGRHIDKELLAQINFHIQAGDIKEIEVSNQKRLAVLAERRYLQPFKVSASINKKNCSFVLLAADVIKATEVATDYIELNYASSFLITGVKELESFIILNDRFKKLVTDTATPEEIEENLNTKDNNNNDKEDSDETKYYKIEVMLETKNDNDDYTFKYPYDFLIKTKNVDAAKIVITHWVNNKIKEENERRRDRSGKNHKNTREDEEQLIELSILSATPFPCTGVIEKEFCLAYLDENQQLKQL